MTDLNDSAGADEPRAEVIGLPPLVRLDPAVAVEVLVDDEWWPGFASAYRGRRVSVSVSVSWSKEPGDATPDVGARGPRPSDLTDSNRRSSFDAIMG